MKHSSFLTVVVGEDVEKPVVDGRRADALLAAHYAQEAALRLCKPGNEVISLKHYFEKVVKIIINSNLFASGNSKVLISFYR